MDFLSKEKIITFFKKLPWTEIIFIVLFILFFFDIFSKTIFYQDGSYKVAAAGYGDIPFHMTEVSYFIHNSPFGLEEPIYSGSKINYPFLINLLSSSFYVLNHNYIFSFNLPSYVLLLSGIILAYLLIAKFIKSILIRISIFLIFFLGSGIDYLRILKDNAFWSKTSISEMLNYVLHLPYSIVVFYDKIYPEQNNIWSNFMTMFLMHQRSFFIGFAAGIMGLYILFLAHESKSKKISYLYWIIVGFLPLVHTHTFVALFITGIAFFIWSLWNKSLPFAKKSFYPIAASAVISGLLIYKFIIYQAIGKSFIVFRLGWMTEPGIGSVQFDPAGKNNIIDWANYMWHNFGLFLPLLAIAIAYFIFKKYAAKDQTNINPLLWPSIFSALLIWITLNIVRFQPWDFDSNKIFAYFFLLGCLIIGYLFEQLRFKFAKIFIILLVIPIISGGMIDALSRSTLADPPLYEIFSPADQAAAKWIVKNTAPEEIVLTGTTHLNIVDSLVGKPVLVGYPGWLWTHGIDYSQRERDIKKIYQNPSNSKTLISQYNINYILLSPKELNDYKIDGSFFDLNYPVAFQVNGTKIYKVK